MDCRDGEGGMDRSLMIADRDVVDLRITLVRARQGKLIRMMQGADKGCVYVSGIGDRGRTAGMAFVLIQHLDPSHHSMLSEIIAKATKMQVEEVKSGVKIRAGRVYVIPPNAPTCSPP